MKFPQTAMQVALRLLLATVLVATTMVRGDVDNGGATTTTATATDTEEAPLSVNVYDGPTDCAETDRVLPWDYIEMHYVGTIDGSSASGTPGKKIDSSRDRGMTFDFQISGGNVIDGWDLGIVGLCKGAKATLVIPPSLAYGDNSIEDIIPAGATVSSVTVVAPYRRVLVNGGGLRKHFVKACMNGWIPCRVSAHIEH